MASALATFKAKAPTYMRKLIEDFPFGVLDAAAVMGNAGHESGGLTVFQERNPRSGRGGLGWFQWTGPRRVKFEAYCARNGLDTRSDQANYAFLVVELKGAEKAAVNKTRAEKSLEAKVKAFENAYERAGVKAYASRNTWAKRALDAWNASAMAKVPPPPDIEPVPPPAVTPPPKEPGTATKVGAGVGGSAAGMAASSWGFDPWMAVLIGVVVAIAILIIVKAVRN